MKPLRKQKRQDLLTPRLAAYSATAVAALAAAPHAQSAITDITSFTITSGTSNGSIPSISWTSTPVSLGFDFGPGFHGGLQGRPVNSAGTAQATFVNGAHAGGTNVGNVLAANVGGYPLNLNLGDAVAGRNFVQGGGAGQLAYGSASGGGRGHFLPAVLAANATAKGYLGFKAKENNHTYYGWLRVQVTNNSSPGIPSQVSLIASATNPAVFGAYGVASDNITAGEVAIPEPSDTALFGLGLLALGAVGVRKMRRRKEAQSQLS
jgi:hypothetical protein